MVMVMSTGVGLTYIVWALAASGRVCVATMKKEEANKRSLARTTAGRKNTPTKPA